MKNLINVMGMLFFLAMTQLARALDTTPGEMALASRWIVENLTDSTAVPPFSFHYGGQPSAELLKSWEFKRKVHKLDDQRTQWTLAYKDTKTGLEVTCVAVDYHDFPTVEWTLYFKNTGLTDSLILEDIQALQTRFQRAMQGQFRLHHFKGSLAERDDYRPFETLLGPKADERIATSGGRSTNSDLPYFNVEWPGGGVILVVGWPGQWMARFIRDTGNGLHVQAGQELTHFKLLPGEEVRSPLIIVQFYTTDWIHGQNLWRRWMIAHNLPRIDGKIPSPQLVACSSHQFSEMMNANEENQKLFIDRYLEEGLKIDYWWMDAGWYVNNGSWMNTGTWEVDPKRFPRGLRAITDHAHTKGVKSIVWFEPERVTKGSWLYEQHPEWLLSPPLSRQHAEAETGTGPPGEGSEDYRSEWRLLNLGDLQARQWLTDHVARLITEQGIDLYRQDFNMAPLDYWHTRDRSDRQGITEINYVTGYLAYWDELRQRHPKLLIDSCASGGRRNDVETLRRSVPLLRSDYLFEPVSQQSHTYGISFWIPYYGTGTLAGTTTILNEGLPGTAKDKPGPPLPNVDTYAFRSHMGPSVTAGWDVRRNDLDYEKLRRLTRQLRDVGLYYLGDYYPLTPFSLATDVWMAWQFDRSDLGKGMVQAFRRDGSPVESTRFKLRGLDPNAYYLITNIDVPGVNRIIGRELMDPGLPVVLKSCPEAAIIIYHRTSAGQ